MNKLAIPAVLVATVMIAGIFAFMPVEKATTVHDQIIAALQGANIVRIQTFIDDVHDNNDSITWTQIVTYDRTGGDGAWQIEKLFLCDFRNESGPPVDIGFDLETNIIDENETAGPPSLRSHVSGSPVQIKLLDQFHEEECVDIINVAFTPSQPDDQKNFMGAHLGGDGTNNVNVRLFEDSCQDSGTDTDGAFLVAYIVGLVDDSQMNVSIDDDLSNECSFD